MKNIPTKLFLVIGEDVENEADFNDLDHEYVCWCQDRINKNDIEYVLASSRSMDSQWIDVEKSKKAVFDERKIRMAFKDFIEDVPNGTAREFFRFLIELSYDEQPPTK
jgi:hypothetical protein